MDDADDCRPGSVNNPWKTGVFGMRGAGSFLTGDCNYGDAAVEPGAVLRVACGGPQNVAAKADGVAGGDGEEDELDYRGW